MSHFHKITLILLLGLSNTAWSQPNIHNVGINQLSDSSLTLHFSETGHGCDAPFVVQRFEIAPIEISLQTGTEISSGSCDRIVDGSALGTLDIAN